MARDPQQLLSGGGARAAHRFHANVLEALEREGSPLREALGVGGARGALGRAKGFRNQWKDAEEGICGGAGVANGELDGDGLRDMLGSIMAGLGEAVVLVGRRLEEKMKQGGKGDGGKTGEGNSEQDGTDANDASAAGFFVEDMDMDDAPWEAVEDGMDGMDWDFDVS